MPVRLFAGILIIGMLANFVIYSLDEGDAAEAGSGWQLPRNENSSAVPLQRASLAKFLGVTNPEEIGSDRTQVQMANDGTRKLVYGGVTYRLTGLVVNGNDSAATLVSDANPALRVLIGGKLPGGGTVKAITVNEIHLINAEGREESVKIY